MSGALAVTGANGFLGRAVVAAARAAAGGPVTALSRRGEDGTIACDLSAPDAAAALVPHLRGARAVIHAAAATTGDAARMARDTAAATDAVLVAMRGAGVAHLVLVSSFSVYDVAGMADGDTLSEASPLVDAGAAPDGYAAAKRAQEDAARAAAGEGGPAVTLARPGAIHGPGRDWSAQVGFRLGGGRVLCPAARGRVPAIHVDRCAEALLRVADDPPPAGAVRAVNLVDPDPPTRADWTRALGLRPVGVPLGPVLALAAPLGRRDRFAARFRPVTYDDAAMRALMAGAPPARPFARALAADRDAAR
ncbi:NAD-dependent epimerase/dehydratase family protein [Jannaschia sp. LMIT008]|uniref:NAD-dependent epimerase/dehydratase family protein n=1 Tax=Jannaschia maritima TaxID=3032585 RepID=UPI0028123115|nr:NAD-dependent epimerase/dehydratase family protein [Jannaschia sp. LMIT008]